MYMKFIGYFLVIAIALSMLIFTFVDSSKSETEALIYVAMVGSSCGVLLWFWMLFDCIKNFKTIKNPKVWLFFLVLANWLASIVYFFKIYAVQRSQSLTEDRKD